VRLRAQQSVPILQEMAEHDEDEQVRKAAHRALEKLARPEGGG